MYHTMYEPGFANVAVKAPLDFLTLLESMYAKPVTSYQRMLLESASVVDSSISTTSSTLNIAPVTPYVGNALMTHSLMISEHCAWIMSIFTRTHSHPVQTGMTL